MLSRILFIIFISLFVISLIVMIIYFTKDKRKDKKHKKRVYKILHQLAEEKDFLLLNDVKLYFSKDDESPYCFDHILFANKYIYVIQDYIQQGGIFGNVQDSTLFIKKEDGRIESISNPIKEAFDKVNGLENALGINHSQHSFISMTVYNDNLSVPKNIKQKNYENCFIKASEITDTIKQAEKDQLVPFDDKLTEKLLKMIKDSSDSIKAELDRLNRRKE